MILDDIGMVASDTSRSRVYLQALIKQNLIPNHVIVLEASVQKKLPGQINNTKIDFLNAESIKSDDFWDKYDFDLDMSILQILRKYSISHELVYCESINEESALYVIANRNESTFIYSGFGGIILKKEILSIGKNFLHVHGGYLPKYKGSTTNYFSLIKENNIAASSIFMKSEIDSGPIIARKVFPPPRNRNNIDYYYDSVARALVLVDSIYCYLKEKKWKFELKGNEDGDIYYIIHPVLKHIAILAE